MSGERLAPFLAASDLKEPSSRTHLHHHHQLHDDDDGGEDELDDGVLMHMHELKQQNEFLRNYSTRLEAELRVYQVKFANTIIQDSEIDDMVSSSGSSLPPWTANSEYLSPLLVAYDARIKHVQSLNNDFKEELTALKGEASKLVERNDALQNELEHNVSNLLQRFDSSTKTSSSMTFDSSDELAELQERAELLADENQILRSQESSVRKDFDEAKLDLDEREQQLESLRRENDEKNVLNVAADERCQEVKAALDAVEHELSIARAHTAEAIQQRQSVQKQLLKAHGEVQGSKRDAAHFRDILTQAELQAKRHIENLRANVVQLEQQLQHMTVRVSELDATLDEARHKEHTLTTQLSSQRTDMEGMLSTIESLEQELSSLRSNHTTVLQSITNTNIEIDEAKTNRDKALAKLERMQQDFNRLEQQRQQEISELRNASEKSLHGACDAAQKKESNLYEEIRKLEMVCANFEADKERAERENRKKTKSYEDLAHTSKMQQSELHDALNESRKATAIATSNSVRADEDLRAATAAVAQLRSAGKIERDKIDGSVNELSKMLKKHREEKILSGEKIVSLASIIEELRQERVLLQQTFAAEIKCAQDGEVKKQRVKEIEIFELKKKMQECFDARERAEIRVVQTNEAHENIAARWREEQRNGCIRYENSMREMKDELMRLLARNQELDGKLSVMVCERDDRAREDNARQQVMTNLRGDAETAEQRLRDVAAQLAVSLSRESTQRRENKELQHALDRAEIEAKRIQRQAETTRRRLELHTQNVYTRNATVFSGKSGRSFDEIPTKDTHRHTTTYDTNKPSLPDL